MEAYGRPITTLKSEFCRKGRINELNLPMKREERKAAEKVALG